MLFKKKKIDALLVLRGEKKETEALKAETYRIWVVPQPRHSHLLTLTKPELLGRLRYFLLKHPYKQNLFVSTQDICRIYALFCSSILEQKVIIKNLSVIISTLSNFPGALIALKHPK